MKKYISLLLAIVLCVSLPMNVSAYVLSATSEMGWGTLLNTSGTIDRATKYSATEQAAVSLRAAQEGAVLLKNENSALPLRPSDKVAIFGTRQLVDPETSKTTYGYLPGGAGSGAVWGILNTSPLSCLRNKANVGKFTLYDTISQNYESQKAAYTPSAEDIAAAKAAGVNKAVMIISRYEGENGTEDIGDDWANPDSEAVAGQWYLDPKEKRLLQTLNANFDQVIVVFNTGNLMDTTWVKDGIDGEQVVDAALSAWYGGHQGPQAVADLLCGDVTPSGKLTQTSAPIENYPSTKNFGENAYTNYEEDIFVGYRYFETFNVPVNYEFGFGLSYTTFDISDITYRADDANITVTAKIKNTGNYAGKEVLQVYFGAPQMGTGNAKLGKPAKELAAYVKTDLLTPGQSQTVSATFPITDMSSYDDTGVTGKKSAWVMEAGNYVIYAGNSVKNVKVAGTYKQSSLRVVEQLTAQMSPTALSKRLLADGTYENVNVAEAPTTTLDKGTNYDAKTYDKLITYSDVKAGQYTVEQLVSQMTIDELASFSASYETENSSSNSGAGGNDSTKDKYGIIPTANVDGPAGPNTYAWSFPSATAIACTFNLDIASDVGTIGGKFADDNANYGAGQPFMWQAAGVNIHRNPLAGRNFEYFSEDPLITGLCGAAFTLRAQEQGIGVVVKHLVANNQETNRGGNDSRMSERALREIYLKGFELICKEADPVSIMTAYNRINGVDSWRATELLVNIVRNEWGWDGMYMSDWDDVGAGSGDMVLAGHNIKMGKNATARDYSETVTYYNEGKIGRSLLEENAAYVVRAMIESDRDYVATIRPEETPVEEPFNPLIVTCYGDSVTEGMSMALENKYPTVLQNLLGDHYTVLNAGDGGERTTCIMARQGALKLYTKKEINFAKSQDTLLIDQGTGRGVVAENGLEPRWTSPFGRDLPIGKVTIDGASYTLEFKNFNWSTCECETYLIRDDAGKAVTIPKGTEVILDITSVSKSNYCDIYLMGFNGTWSSVDDLVAQYQQMIDYRDNDRYLLVIPLWEKNNRPEMYSKFKAAFGDHAVDLVQYCVDGGMQDLGMTLTAEDQTCLANNILPYSLKLYGSSNKSDVHLSANGYKVLANALYDQGKKIGLWTDHNYDAACDAYCNVCGEMRSSVSAHTYDGSCDATCNACGAMRSAVSEHVYNGNCDADCNMCGEIREAAEHTYANACDADCDVCGEIRKGVGHVYDSGCDADCNVCGEVRSAPNHLFDNACDAECNTCGMLRVTVDHVYDFECDTDCNVCGAIREAYPHSYDDLCDTVCNICDTTRTATQMTLHIPSTRVYVKGSAAVDVTGGWIDLAYADGQEGRVPLTADMIAGFNTSSVGTKTLTVTCGGVGATYDITVTDQTALPAITVDSATALTEQTFTVAVRVQNNPGIVSARLQISYDQSKLELLSYAEQDFSGVSYGPADKSPFIVNWCDALNANNTTDGVIVQLTFRVKADAAVGKTAVSVNYDADDVYDYDFNNVTFNTGDGIVDIAKCDLGDVNGDGAVNNKDIGVLQRYVNGWSVTINEVAADLNGDGAVNNKDIGLLQRNINGWTD